MPRKSSNLLKRRLKIAEIVRKQGEIRVESLCEQLGVSGVTIRGDLAYLEQQGYLKRSFGGAISTAAAIAPQRVSPPAGEVPNRAAELEMALHCARLVADRDTLFLGHGAITRKVIPLLSSRKKLRLIVNDLHHALLANEFIDGEVILAGSELIRNRHVLVGKTLDSVVQNYTLSHCILQATSLDATGALSGELPQLAPHYQRVLDNAQMKTLLVTGYPPPEGAHAPAGQLTQLDNLVTCGAVNGFYQQQLFESDFIIRYSNNECFTWTNRDSTGD
ncbi:DeoR/GlpR family DNA-binding transcription regulator [Candidatus Sodalis sp. SoCistrobi]|uniref:DeoR/GlpR family DNA-binding transcription regulator n=1 Tax=Candidatus Sodalis sp. SoCistrobi TaxID=1922216 RepID=UPI000B3232FE|nr:DeoR/GlpR family DNA-binding transcription regulator [Candidatus Sodalis sp. SoCistrobi]